jgi:hypothetical protein
VESPATLNPLLLNSGILEQSRQYSRVPEGREYPTTALTLEFITLLEGNSSPACAGVSLPIFDENNFIITAKIWFDKNKRMI